MDICERGIVYFNGGWMEGRTCWGRCMALGVCGYIYQSRRAVEEDQFYVDEVCIYLL
jgi:hypothetical protein